MDILSIILYVIGGAIVIGLIIKVLVVFGIVLKVLAMAYGVLCFVFNLVTKPLKWVAGKLKELLFKVPALNAMQDTTGALNRKFARFGGLTVLVIFLASLVFVVISLLVIWGKGNMEGSMQDILLNNTFGSFFTLIQNGFVFTPATLVSASFASFLAHVCIDKADKVKWYIWIPYCVVFIAMSSLLCSHLTGMFDAVGTWGYNTITSLWNSSGSTVVKILQFVPLAILGYFAAIFLAITVREYFCSVLFGIMGMIILIVVSLVLDAVNASGTLTDIIAAVTLLGSMIGIEKIRNKMEAGDFEKAEEN